MNEKNAPHSTQWVTDLQRIHDLSVRKDNLEAIVKLLGEALEWYTFDEDGGDRAETILSEAVKLGYTVQDQYVKERLENP